MNTFAVGLSTEQDDPYLGQPGPWGRIECLTLRLSPPLEFIAQHALAFERVVWRFPGLDLSQIAELLASFGIAPLVFHELAHGAQVASSGQIELFPDAAQLREIPPEPRARLYHWLGQKDEQSWSAKAFRHLSNSIESWLADDHLSSRTIQLVRTFVYRHGPYLMFADLPAVAGELNDQAELQRLIKCLARETTLLAQLHVRRGDNLEELAAYWGRGGRARGILPLLESAAEKRRGQLIDIVHLLPAFARSRLYTYPTFRDDGQDNLRDCHWTSLNFFNETPDDRFLDLSAVAQTVSRDWQPTNDRPLLGDLVYFHDAEGTVFHSAVYLADNIVFTKNGPTPTRPWMLMPLDQMLHFYPRTTPVRCRFFRRRDLV